MKEILILSGKGGTGKTTITGSLAVLAPNSVIADCDVDAADLHLILSPEIKEKNEFWSGVVAEVNSELCTACGTCMELCRFEAISMNETASVNPLSCEGCGVCAEFCPESAIELKDNMCGFWFISGTRFGPMVHAQLGIAEENSGKLVALVKRETKAIAEKIGADWIIVDGSPGIGCPVIASLSGADMVLIVTEPTLSGLHDLTRLADLAMHFKIPTCVCINKWDLNPEVTQKIEETCGARNIQVVGRIPFDIDVVSSLVEGIPLIEYSNGEAAQALRKMWSVISSQ